MVSGKIFGWGFSRVIGKRKGRLSEEALEELAFVG
jgi:hypothetical protein